MAQGIVPPTFLPLQVQGVSTFGGAGGATSIPPGVAVLPTGSIISGIISGRNPQGHLVLQTEKGDLALLTTIFFKRGMELTLRLEKAHNEFSARILTVDGQPLAKYVEATSGKIPEQDTILQSTLLNQEESVALTTRETLVPPTATTQNPARTPVAAPSASMTAILLTAPPEGDALSALPAPVAQILQGTQIGAQLVVRVVQLTLPDAVPAPATTSATAPTVFPPAPPVAASPAVLTAPAATLATGYTAGGTPLAPTVVPAASPASVASPLPPVSVASAAVTAASPQAATAAVAPMISAATVAAGEPIAPPIAPNTAPQTATASPMPPSPPSALVPPAIAATPALASAPIATSPEGVTVPLSPSTTSSQVQAASISTASEPVASQSVPLSPAAAPVASTAHAPASTAASTAYLASATVLPQTETSHPSPTAPVITATVLESSAAGITLHSPLGTLRLLSPVPLQPGTQISLEIEQAIQGGAAPVPPGDTSRKLFSSLEELLEVPLPSAFPASAASPYHPRLIPKAGKELTTELLFLMTALKGGDLRKWLGDDTTRRLEDSKEELLRHISTEFSGMKRSVGEEGDPVRWNVYQLPMATATGVEPLRIYHRENEDKEKDEKQRGESGEHFILDVTFTRIGTLQLDGFVKKSPLHFSFELVVRSEHALEEELKQGIREIYKEAGLIAGFDGAVSFRDGREALFHLPKPVSAPAGWSEAESIIV